MNKNLIVGIAIVVLLIGGLLIYSLSRQPQIVNPGTSSTPSTPTDISSQPGTQGGVTEPSPQVTGAGTVKMTMPVYGETWTFGKSHTVRWSAPAQRAGEIVLLDATSKKIVGWIVSSLLPNQVQYSWDTKSVKLSKTSPLAKDIVPGTYILRVMFDGIAQPLDSFPLSLIATGKENIITQVVSIRNYIFSPSVLTVKRGGQIVIVNEDATPYTLQVNGTTVLKLPQWNSYVFDTNARAVGSYVIRLKEQVSERLTVVVE